jgi:hypothetical protein
MADSLRAFGVLCCVAGGLLLAAGPAAAETQPDDTASAPSEDERVQVDQGFPVSLEGAGVAERGEVELRLGAGYSRLRASREDGDDAASGRDLTTPGLEAEIGLGHGLSASLGLFYAFGNVEPAKTGEAEFSLKWSALRQQGLRPALTVLGGISAPFGPGHEPSETALGLLVAQPLARGADTPVLHGNILWFHALDQGENERSNRYAASVALAVPVARKTGVFVGYAREQDSEPGKASQLIELGVRQKLGGGFILAGGAGIGVGDSDTDFRCLFGLQKTF